MSLAEKPSIFIGSSSVDKFMSTCTWSLDCPLIYLLVLFCANWLPLSARYGGRDVDVSGAMAFH
jgi:hypothetical protein